MIDHEGHQFRRGTHAGDHWSRFAMVEHAAYNVRPTLSIRMSSHDSSIGCTNRLHVYGNSSMLWEVRPTPKPWKIAAWKKFWYKMAKIAIGGAYRTPVWTRDCNPMCATRLALWHKVMSWRRRRRRRSCNGRLSEAKIRKNRVCELLVRSYHELINCQISRDVNRIRRVSGDRPRQTHISDG